MLPRPAYAGGVGVGDRGGGAACAAQGGVDRVDHKGGLFAASLSEDVHSGEGGFPGVDAVSQTVDDEQ
jgi:hypothetical protein